MRSIVLLLLVSTVLLAYATVTNSTAHQPPLCDGKDLDSGVNPRMRNETITCAMRAIDRNHDGYITKNEYEVYIHEMVNRVPEMLRDESKVPSWGQLLERCDCNADNKISPLEIYRATHTCLAAYATVFLAHATLC